MLRSHLLRWPPQKVNWEIPASAVEFLQHQTGVLIFAAADGDRMISCSGRTAATEIGLEAGQFVATIRWQYRGRRNFTGAIRRMQ